ncbi:MAG: hypothetical protein AAGK66_08435 [Pseudomonadota bacterium]
MTDGLPPRTEDPKRRKSVAFIMRRRKRGRASMANSKAPEMAGNYYSRTVLHNRGSTTPGIARLFLALLGLACGIGPFIVVFIVLDFGDPSESFPEFTPFLLLGLIIALCAICGLILLAATVRIFWRIIFPQKPHKKE